MPFTRSQKLAKNNSPALSIKSEPYLIATDNVPVTSFRKHKAYLVTKFRPVIKSQPSETPIISKNSDIEGELPCTSGKDANNLSIVPSNIVPHFSLNNEEGGQLSPALIANTLSRLETNNDQFYRQHALAYLYERSASALLRFRYHSLDAFLPVNGETSTVQQPQISQQAISSSDLPASTHSSCDCIQCALQVIHRRFCPLCNHNFSDSSAPETDASHCNYSFNVMRCPSRSVSTHDSHSLSALLRSLTVPESLLRWATELEESRFLHRKSDAANCSSPETNGTMTISPHLDSTASIHNSTTNGYSSEINSSPLRVLPSRACKQPQPPPHSVFLSARRRPLSYSFRLNRKRIKRELYTPFANDMCRFLRDELDLVPVIVASLIARRAASRHMVLRPHQQLLQHQQQSAVTDSDAAPAIPVSSHSSALLSSNRLDNYQRITDRKSGSATQWLSRQRKRQLQRRARNRCSPPDWSSVQYLNVRSPNAASSNRRERAQRHAMRTGARARGNCRIASSRSS